MTFPTKESTANYAEKDVSGWVVPTSAQMDAVFVSVSKHGFGRIEGFNIVTDTFKHVPKSIECHGLKLYPNKRGVELRDWWPGGGMSQQFRSMRTARVFAKSWTNS